MWRRRSAVLLALLAFAATPAGAQAPEPAPPQTTSLDSEAPPGAPPHWLPGKRWVMQHWLPYDETRLYRLLGVDRGTIWRLLRDDTQTIAQLALARGWDPRMLASVLVEPWEGRLRDPSRLGLLRRRALKTLTQGHLAQHLFFHSLHQEAIPDRAPAIFGVASREEYAALRRSEFSPLQICRLNGLSRGHAQERAAKALTAMAARGVRLQAMPAAQAQRLLARQLAQLPRWLQQTRYNGPPPIVQPRSSPATASNYSNNAQIAHDGRRVVFEAYDAGLATVKRRGEIAIVSRSPRTAPLRLTAPAQAGPTSMYNPALSADGRWVAFESAAGNLNFAKRYGGIGILLHDFATGSTHRLSRPADQHVSRSTYNPTLSADGSTIAFEAYMRTDPSTTRSAVVVRRRADGKEVTVPLPHGLATDAYEPHLSGDGSRMAYTVLTAGGESQVYVHDLGSGRSRRVSTATEEAWEPVLSGDGATVAYTAARPRRRSTVIVRELEGDTATVVAAPSPGGLAYEPSLSSSGRHVAFAARPAGDRRSQIHVHDLRRGTTELVSRADGPAGAAGLAASTHPAISGDGRRVAFTSESWNLSPDKCNPARGIFVRDLRRSTTTLVSTGDGANRYFGPTKGSSPVDALIQFVCR